MIMQDIDGTRRPHSMHRVINTLQGSVQYSCPSRAKSISVSGVPCQEQSSRVGVFKTAGNDGKQMRTHMLKTVCLTHVLAPV